MRAIVLLPWLCVVGGLFPGCRPIAPAVRDSAEPAAPDRREGDLSSKLETLRARNAMLVDQVKELTVRAEALAVRVRQLKFVNEQQAKQIEVLADAPEKRDFHETRARAMAREVARLQKRIRQLERSLASLRRGPAGAPGQGQPATSPGAPAE